MAQPLQKPVKQLLKITTTPKSSNNLAPTYMPKMTESKDSNKTSQYLCTLVGMQRSSKETTDKQNDHGACPQWSTSHPSKELDSQTHYNISEFETRLNKN